MDKPLEYTGKAGIGWAWKLFRASPILWASACTAPPADLEQIDLPQMARLYSTATGRETSVDDLKRIAMRQLNLEKALNLRFTDFDRRHDMPTPRGFSARPFPREIWPGGNSTRKSTTPCSTSITNCMAGTSKTAFRPEKRSKTWIWLTWRMERAIPGKLG